ncbi:scavenger receptor class F member 1 [Aplysia californica]|uniref:Scavenger receptor class F member 1 n=1 Tax=Aplysia californica TaxID=6500 RepID=A0ABM0K7V4_APLCA|nr:scavenger receptor class F member 1 [Aplysia californica]
MSSGTSNQTSSSETSDDDFPVAAIVCLAVGGYVILVIIVLLIRHKLVSKGTCKSDCSSSVDGGGCCHGYCLKLSEACPCCCGTCPDGCLSRICGKRKRTNCVDILLCNCCGCTEGSCDCLSCDGCCSAPCTAPSCSTDGCCSKPSISCGPCCAGCCTDCCESDLDPGTCGCLCLEVKLRHPKHGGSVRRSQSQPSSELKDGRALSNHTPQRAFDTPTPQRAFDTDTPQRAFDTPTPQRAFSTHVPPPRYGEVARSDSNSLFSDPVFVAGRKGSNDATPDATLKQRSLSSSPHTRSPGNRLAPLPSPRKVPVPTPSGTPGRRQTRAKTRQRWSGSCDGRSDRRDESSTTAGNNGVFRLSLNSSSSMQLSGTLSDESFLNSSASGRVLINNSNDNNSNNDHNNSGRRDGGNNTNRKSSSRSRRSVRAGQMSQRFPNKVLVSARSLQSTSHDLSLGEDSTSARSSHRSSVSSRALPQPRVHRGV